MSRRRASPALFIKFLTSDSSIVAGDIVAIDVLNDDSVVRADASDVTKMPAVGIVKSVRSTSVIVQSNYIYTFPVTSSLTVSSGDNLWADPENPGKMTSTLPTTGTLQLVARGKKSERTVFLVIEPSLIQL